MSVIGLLRRWGGYSDGSNIHIYNGGLSVNNYLIHHAEVTAEDMSGNVALLPADIHNGVFCYNPNGGNRTVTLPTAAALWAYFGFVEPGQSFEFIVTNEHDTPRAFYSLAITAPIGGGITLDMDSVYVYPGQRKIYKIVMNSATEATCYEIACNRPLTTGHVSYQVAAQSTPADPNDILDNEAFSDGPTTWELPAHASGAIVNVDYPRNVSIFIENPGGANVAGTIEVNGYDADGNAVSEILTFTAVGAGGQVKTTTQHFSVITTIVTQDDWTGLDADEKINLGWATIFGLPCRPGGMLIGVYKCCVDQAHEAIGTVNEELKQITPTTTTDAAARDYDFWYVFV